MSKTNRPQTKRNEAGNYTMTYRGRVFELVSEKHRAEGMGTTTTDTDWVALETLEDGETEYNGHHDSLLDAKVAMVQQVLMDGLA